MKFRSVWVVLVLAVISVATPRTASAQMGVLVGLNSANLKFDPEQNAKPERRTGFVAGLRFNMPVQDMFSVELDALFVQKGAKFSNQGFTQKVKLNYVDIPVLGRINLPGSGPARVHLLVGPSFNFKVSEKFEENGKETNNAKDQVEKFETALVIGGGVNVNRFRMEARYGLGLSNIAKDSGSDKVRNRVFSILVGIGS
jgi:outer membrane protein with beta-barrel domain